MINTLIYINGKLADVSPDTIFALTIKYFDIVDITSRFSNYSNKIKLPYTEVNDAIYEYSRDSKVVNSFTKSYVSVSVIQNGRQLFTDYRGELVDATDGYSLVIYSNEVDVMKLLEADDIVNILGGPINVPPTPEALTNAVLSANNNIINGTKYATPVIDYGRLKKDVVTIINYDFTNIVLEPWEQSGNGSIEFDDTATANFTPGTFTKLLKQGGLSFGADRPYTITLNYDINSLGAGAGDVTVDIYLGKEGPGNWAIPLTHNQTTTGSKVLTGTYTPSQSFSIIAIKIHSDKNASIQLQSITVEGSSLEPNVRVPYYLPLIPYSKIIQALFSRAGKGFASSIFQSIPDESRLFITPAFSDFVYPEKWVKSKTDKVATDGGQVINLVASPTVTLLTFEKSIYNGDQLTSQVYRWWQGTTANCWEPNNEDGSVKVNCVVKLNVTVSALAGGATAVIRLIDFPAGLTSTKTINANGTYDFALVFDKYPLTAGAHIIRVECYNGTSIGSATVTINSATWDNTVDNVPYDNINWSALLSPIDGRTFFKDFLMRFCALFRSIQNSPDVAVNTLEYVINSKDNILDWTHKRDHSKQQTIKFIQSSFAQRNVFRDDDTYNEDSTSNGASINIENGNLPDEKEVYVSIFSAPTETIFSANGLRVPKIPVYNDASVLTEEPVEEVKSALVRLRDDAAADGTIYYNGVADSSVQVAVYSDPGQANRADWSYFLGKYYTGVSRILNDYRAITRYYNLNDEDIARLTDPRDYDIVTNTYRDAFMKVYENGEMFLIAQVHSYVPNNPTKVDLIKIQ